LHRTERDRFRAGLDTLIEQSRGRINQEFRLHAHGADYYWFRMKARPVAGTNGEVVRIINPSISIFAILTARSPSDSSRAWEITTLEALRIRAPELVEGQCVQAGESRTVVARALGVTVRTMDGERMGSFLQTPEGGRAGRKRGVLARYGAAVLAR